MRAIMHWQHRTICRGHNSILHNLYELLGPKTHDYISFYGLRAYGKLSAGGPVASSQVFSCNNSHIAPQPFLFILLDLLSHLQMPAYMHLFPAMYHDSRHL